MRMGAAQVATCYCARLCRQARLLPGSLKERMYALLYLLRLSVWGESIGPVC